jgi:hypothetical protein
MASMTYTWTLQAKQQHGNLFLMWNTNAPFRAQQGQITVYKGTSFPPNPQGNVAKWSWDDQNTAGWDTGLPWGSDWCCAWIAQKGSSGPYVYGVQLTTVAMRAEAAGS